MPASEAPSTSLPTLLSQVLALESPLGGLDLELPRYLPVVG